MCVRPEEGLRGPMQRYGAADVCPTDAQKHDLDALWLSHVGHSAHLPLARDPDEASGHREVETARALDQSIQQGAKDSRGPSEMGIAETLLFFFFFFFESERAPK